MKRQASVLQVLGCALLVLVALLACKSQTKQQVYDAAKPAADVLRAKLVSAGALVEAEPPVPAESKCSAPRPLTFNEEKDTHDTDYIMLLEAKRGAGKPAETDKTEDVDLIFNTPMTQLLRGTNGFFASYMLSERADSSMETRLKRGQNVKYVVMVRSRGTTLDYFLIDVAAPSIVCRGTFEAEADSSLGTRTDNYDLVKKDKRSGKEISRESKSETHDDRKSALYADGTAKLRAHMKAELQLDMPK